MKKREFRLLGLALIAIFVVMFADQALSLDPVGYESREPSTAQQGVFAIFDLIHKGQVIMNTDYDLDTDSSLQKYISTRHPYNDPYYTPDQLESVDSSYVINKTIKPLLRLEARLALYRMAQDFYTEFHKKFVLTSAYRSYQDQKRLLGDGCSRARCAQAGTSEHQAGLAVDLAVGTDKGGLYSISDKNNIYYKRLENNAHKYGFHNTFQKGLKIDGQMEEGRHRRYLGKGLATFLYEHGWTLGEYDTTIKGRLNN